MNDFKYKAISLLAFLKKMQREGRIQEDDQLKILDMIDEMVESDGRSLPYN